jgi:ATP-dependent DNA helicase DinG
MPPPTLRFALPPMLAAGPGRAVVLNDDGDLETLTGREALRRLSGEIMGLAHPGFTIRRLGAGDGFRMQAPFDVLELFLFVHPAKPLLPHARGLAKALGMPRPASLEDEAVLLGQAASHLLNAIAAWTAEDKRAAIPVAQAMQLGGWPWGPMVLDLLNAKPGETGRFPDWSQLPEWEDAALPGPPGSAPIDPDAAAARLARILGDDVESRPAQIAYAKAAAAAFQPRDDDDGPISVLAEAGTGTGKTAGYLAPALTWVERNGHGLWLSTYTKALQGQLSDALAQAYPDPAIRAERIAVRKGRENYLCLLNVDEAAQRRRTFGGPEAVALGLVARWALATRDGDVMSGDFPSWAWPMPGFPAQLTLRHGECVYAACPHYRKCFVEKSVRRARRSPVVIANHALVMAEAARNQGGPGSPVRYVLDEGHHLFDAADNTFAIHVTGREGQEMRRWLRGPETRSHRRGRGLADRLGDLLSDVPEAGEWAQEAVELARDLSGDGWHTRVTQGTPNGAWEKFLAAVLGQVMARAQDPGSPYGAECEPRPLTDPVAKCAEQLNKALGRIMEPLAALANALRKALEDKAEEWEASDRVRASALAQGLERRAHLILPAWRSALASLPHETPPAFSDWFAVSRQDGRNADIGFYRHWVDPTLPLAQEVLEPAKGVLITSATLNDRPEQMFGGDGPELWAYARARTGVAHLKSPAFQSAFPSPFDYAAQTRVFIVNDVDRADDGQLAGATRGLFEAAGGGALGLFTSIRALRAVHQRIVEPLAAAGLTLYAQHVDGLDAGTLVELFRDEEDACLLGTDALRDGVDVPGRALRLVVFDRVPWSRPDILHKARRAHFGKGYDDALVRGRLAQAFGRLIRRKDDRGVFVILDNRAPSRLLTGLPEAAPVLRAGLAESIRQTRAFLQTHRLNGPGLARLTAGP